LRDDSDLQALVFEGTTVRAINGEQYKRLWNADLVAMLQEFAVDFTSPQHGCNGGTGLYAGEQDMFMFMIDPSGWTEIGSEAFAPGARLRFYQKRMHCPHPISALGFVEAGMPSRPLEAMRLAMSTYSSRTIGAHGHD
jgi:hypothetical protein